MPNNWKTYKLGEIADIKGGKRLPKGDTLVLKKTIHPYIRVTDMGTRTIPIEKVQYVPNDVFPKISRYIVNTNDLILSIVGTVGSISIIDEKLDNASLTENCVKITNLKDVDNVFLYYYLMSDGGQFEISKGIVGSTQPKLPIYNINALEILLPENLQEQQSIASILSAIDDKIENNLAINKTLEEMAMALYKHWFVDFGPFQDGEFVESELGMIPKGWVVKRLDELADIGSSKRIFYDEYVAEGIPFYRGKEVIELSKGKSISSELFISEQKFNEIKSKFDIPIKGDILISSVGTIGVSWLVDGFEEFYFKDGNLTWIKKYKTFLKGEYLHLWLNSENGKNQIDGEVIGSTQKALTISSLRNFKILFPNEEVYKQIGNEFIDYYEQRQLNLIEIKTLTQLRDTLLPQLISGAVRLKEFRE